MGGPPLAIGMVSLEHVHHGPVLLERMPHFREEGAETLGVNVAPGALGHINFMEGLPLHEEVVSQ
jgi:hypothetical protein